ncbi:ArnT family glycosyltransferase [[Limnothrix rosea] IAM M-220]|uniref:ArnT family glycosyltransferase n=1 Tax=[Limnothrix rosea] IAM M-220 TaxID=454133 RepID=UPI000962491F|nr:glycosyltransferase family 39 protein [[Limnothrix rosea] IAM M-220]OKH20012.1 dolichyl-phosphate-mannose--protein mannosyltransferase [[Limnothrix rosea] IAM M-220]
MQRSQIFQRWFHTYEKSPLTIHILTAIALSFLGGLAFLWRLGSVGLVDETEPMFAEAARQMLVTGDWITPYYNDVTRFDKPPLVYWLMAIAYKVVGTNAWGARLPSALAAIALMVMIFMVLRTYGFSTAAATEQPDQPKTQQKLWLAALLGSALIALNLQTIVWARTGVSDMLLNACIGSSLVCFFWGYGSGGRPLNRWLPNPWYLAAYASLGLAVLAKGPVGLVLPGLTIMVFLIYLGRFWSVFLEAKPWIGALVFAGITLPWYVLVILRNGQAYLDTFFGYHNYERFTGVVNGHAAPVYFYIPVVLIGFIPWSLYLPAAIARLKLHKISEWRDQPRSAHLGIFATAWFATVFGFFTIAVTKLPSYTIPLLPAGSILVALLWSQMILEPQQKSHFFWWSGAVNVAFLGFLAGFLIYSPQVIGFDPAAPNLDSSFRNSVLPILGASIWAIAMLTAGISLFRSRLGLLLSNICAMVLFVALVLLPMGTLLDQNRQIGLRAIAATITEMRHSDEKVVMIGFEKPSLVFYAGVHVDFFEETEEAITFIDNNYPQDQETKIFLIARDKYLKKLPFDLQNNDIIQENIPYKLLYLSYDKFQ